MQTDSCKLFFYSGRRQKLLTWQSGEKKLYNSDGIIQLAIKLKQTIDTIEPLNNYDFNPVIDINTSLPLMTVPVLGEGQDIVAIFQIINLSG